ncbi:MAG: glycosyltransferase family 4 protein [Bacteroidetes bacterium]|nr:glycosyltransferase family 4 protein [Bacteroidota bacterium]MCW5896243.1 glycosyltransferase family 4 protein [Bacteroidota bacterium]
MKVFVDGIVFGRQSVGGISRTWEELLKRFPNYGVEVDVLLPWRKTNQSLQRVLPLLRQQRVRSDFFYWPSRYFERVSLRDRILRCVYLPSDVEIFHSTYFSTVYSTRVKKVVTINDMIPELYQQEYRNEWTRFGIDAKRQVLENADAIVAISESTKTDLLRLYPWISESKVRVIYLAHARIQTDMHFRDVALKRMLSNIEGRYFLFVGTRAGYKNFDILLSLVKSYSFFKGFKFLCVGPRLDEPSRRRIEEEDLSQNFLFLNEVADEELAVLYSRALAFVFPSKHEGFGLPILEAMANGSPVVCSNSSSFPEVGGDAAFYFDPNSVDSLKEALHRALGADRQKMIAAGRRNVQRFSWERAVGEIASLYKELA